MSASSSAAARSATVRMPIASSRAPIFDPTPHRAVVGRAPMTSIQLSRVSMKVPCGLPKSVAILARTRVSPMPTEQCSSVAASTAAWISGRSATGSSVSTPTNASSQPSTSTTAPGVARSVSITRADAAS